MTRNERYTARTIKLIEHNQLILIKSSDGWYVSCWSNFAEGDEGIKWACRGHAQTFGDLQTAFAILSIVRRKNAKVVSVNDGSKRR